MTILKGFASLVLALATVSTLSAETHCPGNVAGLPFQIVNRHQILVAVSVNHSGPYSFLLDTGTQVTIVDLSLAADLHMSGNGSANVASAGSQSDASFVQVDLLEVGSHAVANQAVLLYDLRKMNFANHTVRGILGEDFLEHYDLLIDNAQSLLCLDDSASMRASVKGPHVALETSANAAGGQPLPSRLIVAVSLSDGMRPIRLMLDSGADFSLLYNARQLMALAHFPTATLQGNGVDGAQRAFSFLPPQDVKVGPVHLSGVAFVTLAGARKDSSTSDFDGLLTLGLFRRVFIDHADHFAVLEPR
jgi:hypothetical protein